MHCRNWALRVCTQWPNVSLKFAIRQIAHLMSLHGANLCALVVLLLRQASDTRLVAAPCISLLSSTHRSMMRSAACLRPPRPLLVRAQRCKPGRVVLAHATIETPSSATGSDVLHQVKEHTVVLSDDTLAAVTTPQEAESSAALVNFGLLSHVLANTSAFSEFQVRDALLHSTCAAFLRGCVQLCFRDSVEASQAGVPAPHACISKQQASQANSSNG